MLHGRVLEVDLEPVPHHDGDARQGEDVLHRASQRPGSRAPAPAASSQPVRDGTSPGGGGHLRSKRGDPMPWRVITYRLRVAVWRELRRLGAVTLQQGTWAVPE